MRSPIDLAKAFHEAYERLAPEFGYKTREESAVAWEDVPEQNKKLMVATIMSIFEGPRPVHPGNTEIPWVVFPAEDILTLVGKDDAMIDLNYAQARELGQRLASI